MITKNQSNSQKNECRSKFAWLRTKLAPFVSHDSNPSCNVALIIKSKINTLQPSKNGRTN
ncbi:hypothetical protein BpHYR1_014699 [Brachionus plicatilis]|uniref:Uncharacterized protein n=1 Tax=Brachionus plicatilis TaxID=10195 RepID=A0A3M7RHJ2_BRAPC|nr:hypothetical protein BpHYR1_014699 [Brachionus plicatilis]